MVGGERVRGGGWAAQHVADHSGYNARRPYGVPGFRAWADANLDALARQSVVFTRAYSQVPLTAPSHATILTGTYPQFHQVNNFGVPLATTLPYAPAILHAHGYHTAAFVGALVSTQWRGAFPALTGV